MTELTDKTISAIETLVQNAQDRPHIIFPNGDAGALIPDGFSVHNIKTLNPVLPDFIDQAVVMDDMESYIAYLNRYKEAETTGFADLDRNQVFTLIDYHAAPGDGDVGQPDRRRHAVSLKLPFERDWARWRNADGELMSQEDFVYFLEEMSHTVQQPSGADLMELVANLSIARTSSLKNIVRKQSGVTEIEFREEDQAQNSQGQSIKLPDEILLNWPIFKGHNPIQVAGKFRYRKAGSIVNFKVDILNRASIEQDAFQDVVKTINEKTEIPFYFGKLEN